MYTKIIALALALVLGLALMGCAAAETPDVGAPDDAAGGASGLRLANGLYDQEDGTVIGLENISEIKLDIENAINDSILPRPYYEFSILEDSGKRLLVLKVFKGEFTPYLFKGKAYMRSDTASIQVDKSQYENLILQGRNLTFEDLVNDDQALTFQDLEFQLKKILNITQLTPDLLKTLGLIKDGKYKSENAETEEDSPITLH